MSKTTTLTTPKSILDPLRPQPEQSNLDTNVRKATDKQLSFDPEALTRKYEEEREKRLQYTQQRRGLSQYKTVKANDDFSSLLKDPYISAPQERQPTFEDTEVLIVGGGYGAQLTAVELLRNKITDFKMIEKGGDFGGTWYWNRYPGAQCDIESYVYMPLLEETDYVPTQKYAGGQELLHHAQAIGRKYDLYSKAHFQTEVKKLVWQDERARWAVHTDRGDVFSARFVIPVAGPLHRPKLPDLPGLGSFKGHSFHTTRWDYNYTGGDPTYPEEGLPGLKDKRVGVIGTGATAVQIVPHLARAAKELYVIQRTPSSIDVRGNKPTDPEWVSSLGEHWQRKRMDNFNIIVNGGTQDEDLVSDGWTDLLRKLLVHRGQKAKGEDHDSEQAMQKRQLLDFAKMEQIRHRCDEIVTDPVTAEALKPYYNQFCKRPCFHDDYLPSFNKPNVHLIDTAGAGVEAITPSGLIANGVETELDCIIYATGFDLASSWTTRSGIDIYGQQGQSLSEKWATGPATFHGHSTRGFPNLFLISSLQAGRSPNFLHAIAFQAEHISYILAKSRDGGIRTVEPTQKAEEEWVQTIVASTKRGRGAKVQCTPGYYNNEGQTSEALSKKASYGGGCLEYMALLTAWREEDRLEGLELVPWGEGSGGS